jgi:hypothetical protein
MEYQSPFKQSVKYGLGIALGTLIYQLAIGGEYGFNIYRPVFVGILSTIILFGWFSYRNSNKN